MSYGKLEVVAGPMFAGKTTELLKKVLLTKSLYNKVPLVIKPSFDNRYSETEIVSHDGLKTLAHSVMSDSEIIRMSLEFYDLIVFDEVQFFTEPNFHGDIIEVIRIILRMGKDVFATGLDMDWQGTPFDVTSKLLAMADDVTKLKAICSVSGQPAAKTFKKDLSGGTIELGATDKYEARSNQHWAWE